MEGERETRFLERSLQDSGGAESRHIFRDACVSHGTYLETSHGTYSEMGHGTYSEISHGTYSEGHIFRDGVESRHICK